VTRRSAAVLLVLSLAALAVVLVPAAGLAAKGGNGPGGGGDGGSALTGPVLVTDVNDDDVVNFADQVTFEVSTSATDQPMVRVDCYQNGSHVYWASAGFYESYPWAWARNFTLKSSNWTSGAADCTATLYTYDGRRFRDLTSLGFAVEA
jgi:hypothetical protein